MGCFFGGFPPLFLVQHLFDEEILLWCWWHWEARVTWRSFRLCTSGHWGDRSRRGVAGYRNGREMKGAVYVYCLSSENVYNILYLIWCMILWFMIDHMHISYYITYTYFICKFRTRAPLSRLQLYTWKRNLWVWLVFHQYESCKLLMIEIIHQFCQDLFYPMKIIVFYVFFTCFKLFSPCKQLSYSVIPLNGLSMFTMICHDFQPTRKRSWRFQRLFVANPQCMVGAFLQEQQIREVFGKIGGGTRGSCSRLHENLMFRFISGQMLIFSARVCTDMDYHVLVFHNFWCSEFFRLKSCRLWLSKEV